MSLTNLMRVSVVIWSGTLLTAYYAKILPQMDATFMAGLLTSTLASLGVEVSRRSEEEEKPKTPQPPQRTPKT